MMVTGSGNPSPSSTPCAVGDLPTYLPVCSLEYVALVRRTQTLGVEELQAVSGQFDAVYFHPVRPRGTRVHARPHRYASLYPYSPRC